jgi:peptidase M23-like protein/fibronectin type III domain protein
VLAAADGTVQLAGSDFANPCFGQTVTIDHANGYTTRYAHMSTIGVVPGQNVTRGQTLGTSGNTGCSTGPHLHFGVYITSSWTAIDPYGWAGPAGADPWPSDQGDLWLTGWPRYALPDAPTNLLAIAGDASATVSWNPPAYTGGLSVLAYMVTASPGGLTTTVGPGATSATLTGLSNGTTYTFTVVADNAVGNGTHSSPSNSIIPPAWPGRFHPLPPARILDTRTAIGLGGHVGAGQTLDVPVLGVGGVPSSGVAAVAMNVTVTNPSDNGYLTVYPTGVARPLASNLDFVAGQTVANLVTVAVGTAGKVTIYNSSGGTDVIFDVAGWVSAQGMTTVTAGQYRALVPARILDTRGTIGRLGPDQTMDLQVAGRGGVPLTGASAVVVNVTVTSPSAASYLTVYPSGVSRPLSSNLGFVPGQTLANRVAVELGTNGKVSLYNLAGSTDVVVDVGGWFTDASSGGTGGEYTGVSPVRLLDTRTTGGPVGAGATMAVPVAGQVGLPGLTSVTPPTAVVLNVTVTNPTAAGFLTVYPSGGSRPLASDLDFSPGQTVPNLVVVKLGADGKLALYNLAGSTDVVIDVLGWYD